MYTINISLIYFTFGFFKAASHANPGAGKNEQDQSHIFHDTYSENCYIHQVAMKYHSKHKNHGIYLTFLLENYITNSFCMRMISVINIFQF